MNLLRNPTLLTESRRFCRRLSKNSGSNFLWAFPSLTKPKRQAMYALYAFMRFTDDIIDEVPVDRGKSPLVRRISSFGPEASPRDRLKHWRALLRLWLRVDLTATNEMHALQLQNDGDAFWDAFVLMPSLVDTVERYQIPPDYLLSVLDGVEMDLTENRYQTFAKLEIYCERVASAVGLACIHIWGFEGRGTPEAATVLELARKVGIAYQLTNILRDLKEDAAMGRVYLPLGEISAAGYSVEELKQGVANAAFERLIQQQIARAEDYYRASRELYHRLKPEGKKIFGLMTATYHAILQKIAAHPADVFRKRIRPGTFERLWLLARWTCFPPKELP